MVTPTSKDCASCASCASGLNWVAPFGGNCCAVETTNASYASPESYYEPYYEPYCASF